MDSLPKVQIFTDGSGTAAIPNGGWAAIIRYEHAGGTTERIITGHIPGKTTNIICEMQAVISGLSALKRRCEVLLITDLSMIDSGIREWLPGWIAKGWRGADKKEIKNIGLWKEIYRLIQFHKVTVKLVKGHTGVEWNELADRCAGKARLGELTNETRLIPK